MNNEFKQYEQFLNEYKNMSDEEQFAMIEDAVYETLKKRTEREAKRQHYIKAGDLTVGCQLAEADGYLFDVIEIVKETSKTITVRLASDFSMFRNHWAVNGGILKTFRKTTILYGNVA